MFNNMIKIKVSGKNINRFIERLYKNNIDILDLKYVELKSIIIKIYYKDYPKIEKLKSIYNYEIIDYFGKIKLKKMMNTNKYLILFLVLGLVITYLLSNIIFNVEIATDDRIIKNLIINEMKENNIYIFSVKKKYEDIKRIVEKIKNNNKNTIEWIEIKSKGTKYIVNFLERKKNRKENENKPRHVVAKKSGIIKKIIGSKGVIIESVNNYVNKGDIIISGEIKNNEEIKDIVSAQGKVYAEVWYKVKIDLPILSNKIIKTDKFNTKYNLKFIDKYLFKSKYNYYFRKDNILYKNILLPISIVINKDQKIIKNDKIYIPEEAIEEAYKIGIKKIEDRLNENEYIILKKKLNYFIKGSTIELDMFFKVYEDITSYSYINNIEE